MPLKLEVHKRYWTTHLGIHMQIQCTISEYICISRVVTKSRVMILHDHWTNHKLRKKQANQKRLHMSVRLRDSNTILCTNSRTFYTGGVECLRRRLNKCRFQKKYELPVFLIPQKKIAKMIAKMTMRHSGKQMN